MPICPKCFMRDLVKHGMYNDRQRYKCQICGKTTTNPRQRTPKGMTITSDRTDDGEMILITKIKLEVSNEKK